MRGVTLERDHRILDRVDWDVMPGEHWVILGANGSGKTNLLRLLTRYQVPTRGEVFVLSDEPDGQELRKRIGLVSSAIAQKIEPIETAFEVAVSGRDAMINHWGKIGEDLGKAARRRLREVGATKLIDRRWGNLSQGERQRVLVARALMNPIELLVLDEPCAGLDPAARENFLGLIERIAARKNAPSILLVTHHVEEITPVFTKALVLGRKGRILASGATSDCVRAEILSEAFGAEVNLSKRGGRYYLSIERNERAAF